MQLENIEVEKMEVPDREHLTEVYARVLRGVVSDNSLFKEKINVWATKRKLPQSLVTRVIKNMKKNERYWILKRPLRVQDVTEKLFEIIVRCYLLQACQKTRLRTPYLNGINEWKVMLRPKNRKIIEQVGALNEENQRWGKVTYVNKESYKQLNETLNVKAPFIYKCHHSRIPTLQLIRYGSHSGMS